MKIFKKFLSKNSEIYYIKLGTFKLDGGSMFGTVPKTIWNKIYPCDEKNRIILSQNCLIIVSENFKLLIEPGCGNKWDEKRKKIFEFEGGIENLENFGFSPDGITHVSFTHLHFDHSGGATKIQNGSIKPFFENAEYIIRKEELEDAINSNERTKASYLKEENIIPLLNTGKVKEIEKDGDILPGIKMIRTDGHTRGHVTFLIEDKFLFLGDLVPTSKHIHLPYIMAYDNFPIETLKKRKDIYKLCSEREIQVFFPHDLDLKTGYIVQKEGKYTLKEIE